MHSASHVPFLHALRHVTALTMCHLARKRSGKPLTSISPLVPEECPLLYPPPLDPSPASYGPS